MLGRFSEEALRAFAEAHNLNTGNQDFSEGVFDFKVCQKPDGKHYGIDDAANCAPPAWEVGIRPGGGLFGRTGAQVNYDTAKRQGEEKTNQGSRNWRNKVGSSKATNSSPVSKKPAKPAAKPVAKPEPKGWSREDMNRIADDMNDRIDRVAKKGRQAIAGGMSPSSVKSELRNFIKTAWNETVKNDPPNSPNRETVKSLMQDNLDQLDNYLDRRNDM